MAKRKVLVTAADQFPGLEIAQFLNARGYQVTALCSTLPNLKSPIIWERATLEDPAEYEKILNEKDLVIHCGTLLSFDPQLKTQLYTSNVLATRDLVNACLDQGVRHLIMLSNLYTLARSSNPLIIGEDTPGNPFFHNECFKTLFHAELEIHRGAAEGLDGCIFNMGWMFNPENDLAHFPFNELDKLQSFALPQEIVIPWLGMNDLLIQLENCITQENWPSCQFPVVSGIFTVQNDPASKSSRPQGINAFTQLLQGIWPSKKTIALRFFKLPFQYHFPGMQIQFESGFKNDFVKRLKTSMPPNGF